MNSDTTPWQDLHEFALVDLSESFVLSCKYGGEELLIDVDLFLCRAHPLYEEPRPSEGACFRPASIQFPACTGLHTRQPGPTDSDAYGAASAIGPGKIFDLKRSSDGCYEISGEFGEFQIFAGRPILRITKNN